MIEFFEEVKKYVFDNYEIGTYRLYKTALNNFLNCTGNKKLSEVNYADLENYKHHRIQTVKKVTCNIEVRTIKAVFNLAMKWDILEKNKLRYVNQFHIEEKSIKTFTRDEVESLINGTKNIMLKNVILFTVNTGLRLNEVLNIQYSDIDLNNKLLYINNKTNFKTKNKRIRMIPLNNTLWNKFFESKVINNPDYYLFQNPDTKDRYTKDYVTRAFKRVVRKLQLSESLTFHCLRHTFITNLTKTNVNPFIIKDLAGHSDIKTTLSYVHLNISDMRNAVDSLNNL